MEHNAGFTLLELLVTMAIVMILTATAIPEFQQYRAHAYDLRARLDLRHVAIAEEAYFLVEESYLSCADDSCLTLPGIRKISDGTSLSIQAETESFTGISSHIKGTGVEFNWDSTEGGFID